MDSVLLSKKEDISRSAIAKFRSIAVWEIGYNLCLSLCRAADASQKYNPIIDALRMGAAEIPVNLSKSASFRKGRKHLMYLRAAFISTKKLSTLLMLCHDLGYIPSDQFIHLNSKVNDFSTKLFKYIKYTSRKIKAKKKK
ncbi:four helix bundle protein [Candidatus Woesearchaeota archaeon]|nr:four helix bundle protein [Candidatus Woesearchaeota archaeon]